MFLHVLVEEDYELLKSTSQILSVPLTLEWVNILSYPTFLFSTWIGSLIIFNVRYLRIITYSIWADDTALNPSHDKPSDLSQQVDIGYGL